MKKPKLLSIFLVTYACGCHNNPELRVQNPPQNLPNGWQVAKSEDGKVSIGVYPGWRAGVEKLGDGNNTPGLGEMARGLNQPPPSGDPNAAAASSDLSRMMSQIGSDMDKMEKENEKKQLAELRKKGILIQVLDNSRPTFGEARTNYNVKVGHFDYNATLEEGVEVEKKRFLASVKPTTVKLPIGEARRMEETRELRDGGMLTLISYLVVNGHDLYSLRFTAEGNAEAIKQIDNQVAQTLRIKS